MPLDIDKIPAHVLKALRHHNTDEEIKDMSPDEAFDLWLGWNGLPDWGDSVRTAISGLAAAETVAPATKESNMGPNQDIIATITSISPGYALAMPDDLDKAPASTYLGIWVEQKNLEIGDKGRLHYAPHTTFGLWFFLKD